MMKLGSLGLTLLLLSGCSGGDTGAETPSARPRSPTPRAPRQLSRTSTKSGVWRRSHTSVPSTISQS